MRATESIVASSVSKKLEDVVFVGPAALTSKFDEEEDLEHAIVIKILIKCQL